jgi:3-oxoacyl-[acyl-carrier protein] reductase
LTENNTGTRGKLAGKSAIVTGASRGIGAAIASRFASEGSDVLVNYSNSLAEASALVEKINEAGAGRAVLNRADVSKIDEIKLMASSALREFGKIDILVNNAGVLFPKDFFSSSEEEFDKVVAVNLKGTFFCCQAVAEIMRKQGYGRIINIASVSALAQPTAFPSVNYVASKTGVLGITRALAVNLAPYNIRVNAVCPGLTDTDMAKWMTDERRKLVLGESMVHRMGKPEEIANACAFLASDEADFVTGEILTVGGGRGMR